MKGPHVICSVLLLAPASAFIHNSLSATSQNGSLKKLVELHGFRRGTSFSGRPFLNTIALMESPSGGEKKESTMAVLEASTKSTDGDDECVVPEELNDTQKLMKQVKDAGVAGIISYALWEFGFWALSVPVCVFGYRELTGHWPDFQNQEDLQKLGAEAFAFVNFARFAVPLRIGLALGTTPWIQKNVVDNFKKDEPPVCDTDE